MKKSGIILLTLLFAVSFASCNKNETDSENKTSESSTSAGSTTIPAERVSHIAQSIEKGHFESFDGYSDEEKEKIKKAVEADGYTLEYNEDGSGTLSNEEVTCIIGRGWVENEFTKGLPTIDFGKITKSVQDKDEKGEFYMFLVQSVNAQEAAAYVDNLKKIGFAANGEDISDIASGVVIFEGTNAQKKTVSLALSPNGFTLKIYK